MDVDQTAVPLELDQIYDNLDKLNVALGPNGANREGALSDLLQVTADELRRPGRAVQPDDPRLLRLQPDAERQPDRVLRLDPRAAGLHQHPGRERPDGTSVQRLASPTSRPSWRVRRRSWPRPCATSRSRSARSPPSSATTARPWGATSRASTGWPACWRSSATRSTRSSPRHPLALNNLALTYNPQAGTLDTRSNLGENIAQLENDPAAFLCGILDQADDSGTSCDAIEDVLARQGANRVPFGQGPNPAWQERYDPSLGGLVEEDR